MNDDELRRLLRRADEPLAAPDPAFPQRLTRKRQRRRWANRAAGGAALALLAGFSLMLPKPAGTNPNAVPGEAEFAALRARLADLEAQVAALKRRPTRQEFELALDAEEAAATMLWRADKLRGRAAAERYALVELLFPQTLSAAAARQRRPDPNLEPEKL